MANPGYEFSDLGGSPDDGYNDPLRTIFDRDYNNVVAREAIQNVLDAVADRSKPVVVKFQLEHIAREDIPAARELEGIFEGCGEYSKSTRAHFQNAIKILKSNRIPVLKISDFNTVGLSGDDEDQTGNFYGFLKSVGSTDKSGTALGSYGLGKGSFVAVSAFDTFFVSSRFRKKGKLEHVFMGSLRVTTHREAGRKKRGVGSYGYPGQLAIRNVDDIPKYFRRSADEAGTDIFVLAYRDPEGWKALITKSVLRNFWLAVEKEQLEVHVGGIVISSKTLDRLIHDHYQTKDQEADWKKKNPLPFYEAYKKGEVFTEELHHLGKVSVHIRQGSPGEISPNYVHCFRKTGMLIYPKNFHSVVPYAGVFVCDTEKGNDLLRKMEPPNHDEWDVNSPHAKDESGRTLREIRAADREYKEFIKDQLKKLVKVSGDETLAIAGLEDYLFLPAMDEDSPPGNGREGSGAPKPTADEASREALKALGVLNPATHLPVKVMKRAPGGGDGNEAAADGAGDPPPLEGEGGDRGKGTSDTDSTGTKTGDVPARIVRANCRSFAVGKGDKVSHRVVIRSTPNLRCRISLKAGTDDSYEALSPSAVDPQGAIRADGSIGGVTLDKEGMAVLRVDFGTPDRYSLSAVVYEDK